MFCLQPAAVSADPEFNRIADDTFRSTEQRLCRTPINTKEDAFAALKFIEHELADDGTAWDFLKPVSSRCGPTSKEDGMTVLWFDVRLWLANRLLDLATAILPEDMRAERERLRRLR